MTPPRQLSPRALAKAAAACVLLVFAAILFIDRPVVAYVHAALGSANPNFDALTHIVDPIPVAAGLIIAWAGIAALCGVRPGPHGRTALRIAVAVLIAIAVKEQLKVLAGRTWAETWTNNNPSYIKDGVFGFFPLKGLWSGGRAYHSFPSGHMTAVSVASVSLALSFPRGRWLAPIPIALVAVGMIGANYHWVSDLIAGTALGSAVALAAHRLGTPHFPFARTETIGPAGHSSSERPAEGA